MKSDNEDRKEFGRAVIIGLGGSGESVLLHVKKLFLEHCGVVPPSIRLLHLDTDNNRNTIEDAVLGSVKLTGDEFCHLPVGSVGSAILSEYVRDWWISDAHLDRITVSSGTQGVRQVGRLALFVNIDSVRRMLKSAFDGINAYNMRDQMDRAGMGLLDSDPQVLVVGSFAGGTGSGSFVDFSILCRLLGGDKLNGKGFFYSAYFILPGIYAERARTHAFQNSYAALLELEKLNQASPAAPYEVQYGPDAKLRFRLESPPYHMVSLLDSRCIDGTVIGNPDQLFRFVGESIFNVVGALGARARSVVDNIMTMKNTVRPSDWQGCNAIYSTLGIGTLTFPTRQLRQGLALRVGVELIDEVLRRMPSGDSLPTEQANSSDIAPFLQKENLHPSSIHEKLLPPSSVPTYQKDDTLDLRDPDLQEKVKNSVDFWENQVLVDTQRTMEKASSALKTGKSRAILEMLERVRNAEGKGERPKGSYRAAVNLLIQFMETAKKDVNGKLDQKEIDANRDRLQQEVEQYYSRFPEARPKFFWATGPVRTLYSEYAQARQAVLEAKAGVMARREALAVYDELLKALVAITDDLDHSRKAEDEAKMNLERLKARFVTGQSDYSTERLREGQSLFEVFVGDRENQGQDMYSYLGRYLTFKGADLYDKLLKAAGAGTPQELALKSADELERLLCGLIGDETRSLEEVGVLKILEDVEKENPGERCRLIGRALENAKLLLSLNTDEHAGKHHITSKFCVTGGYPLTPENRKKIEPCIPVDERVDNQWASTGDLYRLTFCTFFSVAPAANILGLGQMRNAYLERVYPPSHTDRRLLFHFQDLIPESPGQVRALRLLTLAMLPGIELITHERPASGGSLFRLKTTDSTAFPDADRDGQSLPGRAGRFYELWAELSRDQALMDRIETAVLDMCKRPEATQGFLPGVARQLKRFEDTLENIRKDLRLPDIKPFNKMITGWLYQKQADFLRVVSKERLTPEQALKTRSE
jgi:hypothetical protein